MIDLQCFSQQLLENLNVDHLPSDESHPHVLRVGWSADDTSMQLGKLMCTGVLCYVISVI